MLMYTRPQRLCVLLAAVIAAGFAPYAGAQTAPDLSSSGDDVYAKRDLDKLQRTFTRLAEQVKASVVAIETRRVLHSAPRRPDSRRTVPNSQGSGFIIRSDGTIATNHHVVEGGDEIIVTLFNGKEYEAELIEFDPRSDLAVIRIPEKNLRVAPLGDLSEVNVGQWCFTVGSPFGVASGNGNLSISFGGVSAIGRSLTDYLESAGNDRFYGNLIETDASINPGNSGGPLFDLEGRVIGVNTAMVSRSGVNEGAGYAVPMSPRTRTILNTLADDQIVRYGFLGVQVNDWGKPIEPGVPDELRGAVIIGLTGDADHSPAARAGLLPDDIITEFAGEHITGRDDLIRIVGATPVGQEAPVVYYRDGRRQSVKVLLDERVETATARARSGTDEALLSMTWRGCLLVEPTDAFLISRTNLREKPGLYVAEVPRGSQPYRRGLREKTMIVGIDGNPVRTLEDFKSLEDAATRQFRIELDDGTTVTVPK